MNQPLNLTIDEVRALRSIERGERLGSVPTPIRERLTSLGLVRPMAGGSAITQQGIEALGD